MKGVAGTWKDLTDSVNFMAGNLTAQVRGIAKVVTAVANGDLKRKLTVEAKGEIAELADTINEMIDTLATFADQVTTVAREVGVEGQLGGQAKVPGPPAPGRPHRKRQPARRQPHDAGARHRRSRHRRHQGRPDAVDHRRRAGRSGRPQGHDQRDDPQPADTTQKNTEQDWLKTNLAKFSRMLQGQRDLTNVGRMVLSELCPVVAPSRPNSTCSIRARRSRKLKLLASYASEGKDAIGKQFDLGEGLVGQCALEKQKILLNNLSPDYIRISSGLGEATPRSMLVLPARLRGPGPGRSRAGLASSGFNPTHQAFLDQLTESIGIVLNTIEANMRTEDLLKQSQSLAQQLQNRQQQLQQTNEELQEKAQLLAQQNQEVERKNSEVEQARQALEEKAEQLALTSQVQVRVPRQHVPRIADAAQQLAHPFGSTLEEPRGQPDRQADGVRARRSTPPATIF